MLLNTMRIELGASQLLNNLAQENNGMFEIKFPNRDISVRVKTN